MILMRATTPILIALILAGCEGRQVPTPPGATVADGGLQKGPSVEAGAYWSGDAVPKNKGVDLAPPVVSGGGCLVAIRVDICCPQPVAAAQQQLSQDPCLVPWASLGLPHGCTKKPDCSNVKCKAPAPASRLVKVGPGGVCVFTSECTSSSQCGVATDVRRCCSCPEGYPRSMLGDPCLVPYGDGPKAGPPCPNPNLCAQACGACYDSGEYPLPVCKASAKDKKLKTCQIDKLSP